MHCGRTIVLLLLCAGCSEALDEREQELQGWLQDVFLGINSLPRLSGMRRVITFGDKAFPALLGSSDMDQFIALAEHQYGRVAAIARHNYLNNFIGDKVNNDADIAQLHHNLKRWLSRGACQSDECICQPLDSAALDACLGDATMTILVWQGPGDWPTVKENNAVNDWVKAGGALVHAFTATQFPEVGSAQSILTLGFYKPLWQAGIAYSPNSFNSLSNQIDVATDEATVSRLSSLNFQEVCKDLTYENAASNRVLTEVMDQVSVNQDLFPRQLAKEILPCLKTFAIDQESQMNWPIGSPTNNKAVSYAPPPMQFMFKVYYLLGTVQMWKRKAPSSDLFPGDVSISLNSTSETFTFQSKVNTEYFSTGLYLLPGKQLSVEILNDEADVTWQKFELHIGSHTDNLEDKFDMLGRWPRINRKVMLLEKSFNLRWMFGGLVYIKANSGKGNTLNIRVSGAIPTPYFNLEDPEASEKWNERRESAGLVADIRGRYSWFTMPAYVVRNYTASYMRDQIEKWDSSVINSYNLFGYPGIYQRQQWVTYDIHITKGSLHSGYPICGKIKNPNDPDGQINPVDGDWENRWGVFHEIGHNLADAKWKWTGNGEVINNLVGLLNIERLTYLNSWPIPKIDANINTCLDDYLVSPQFPADTKCGLLVFSQLIRDFGFNCMYGVFQGLWDDEAAGTFDPSSDSYVVDQWVRRYSLIVGYNLLPLFEGFWKYPISEETRTAVSSLLPFLPDDAITQDVGAVGLMSSIVGAYPGLTREVITPPANCPAFDMWYWKV